MDGPQSRRTDRRTAAPEKPSYHDWTPPARANLWLQPMGQLENFYNLGKGKKEEKRPFIMITVVSTNFSGFGGFRFSSEAPNLAFLAKYDFYGRLAWTTQAPRTQAKF